MPVASCNIIRAIRAIRVQKEKNAVRVQEK